MSLRRDSSILNPDTMAFDVTGWPRQAIVELAARIGAMEDPLSDDFAAVTIGPLQVRRINENETESALGRCSVDLNSAGYLLIKVRRLGSSSTRSGA